MSVSWPRVWKTSLRRRGRGRGRGKGRGRASPWRPREGGTGKKGNCGVTSVSSRSHTCQPTLYSHRAQLSKLEGSDAEFHDFLKKNDPALLNFDLSEDEAVGSGDDSDAVSDVGDADDSDDTGGESDMDVVETPPPSVTSYPAVSQQSAVAAGVAVAVAVAAGA